MVSSKRLIQGHALFLFILAVYLTKSPEVITDSDVVYFTLRHTIKIVRWFYDTFNDLPHVQLLMLGNDYL